MNRPLLTAITAVGVLLAASGCDKVQKCFASDDADTATTNSDVAAPAPAQAPAYAPAPAAPAPTAYAPAPAYPAPAAPAPAAPAPAQATPERVDHFVGSLQRDSYFKQFSAAQLVDMGNRTCAYVATATGSRSDIWHGVATTLGLSPAYQGAGITQLAVTDLCPQFTSKWNR